SIDRNTTANFNWLDKTGPMTSSIKGAIAINSSGAVGITGLASGSAVYTDGSGNLTTSIPNSSTLGYWTRNNASGYLYNTTLTDKIGLGTNTPVAKLELEGPAADWNETTPGTAVGSIHLDPGTGTTNYGSAITWGASDNSNGDVGQAGIYVRSSGSYGTKMYFGTTDAYVTGAKTRMMLDANGNVGIGTTAPAHKLDVNGNIKTSGHLVQGALVAKPNVTWSAGGSSTGAVIIKLPGTVANYGMLHMQIDVYEYGSTGVTTYFVGGHNWSSQWYNYNCNTVGNSTKKVRLGVKDNQYCVVLGDNTSSWSYGHVVLSTITNGGYYSGTIDLGGTYTAYQDAAAESYTWISADLNKTVTTANGTTDYIPKFTSATTFGNSQIYDNGTSIGIGTASPGSYKLNVQQGGAFSLFQSTNDAQIELKGTDAWGGIKWTDVGGTDYSWFYGATGTWSFGGGGSAVSGKKMHIHGSTTIGAGFAGSSSPANGLGIEGSLGVGVANPTAKLHVVGGGAIIGTASSGSVNRTLTVLGDNTTQVSFGSYPYDWSPAIQIQNNDNTKMTWISAGGSGAYSAYNARYLTNGSGLDFYTGSNAFAATITAGGYVGIGTGSPGYKLQVYGPSGAYPAQVGSPDGYLAFGPANTGWCHFQTDRPSFYFNPKVTVDGNVEPYTSNSNDLGTSGRTWRTLYIGPTNANFNGSNGGSLELGADNSVNGTGTPYIDFHSTSGAADYHHRIIAQNNNRIDFYTNYTGTYSGLNVSIDVVTGRSAVADVSLWTNYYTRYGGYYDIINDLDSIDNIRPIKWHNFKTGKMETAMDVSTLPLNTKIVGEDGAYLTDGANMLAFNTGAIRQLRAETKSRDEGMNARLNRLENLVSQLTGKQLGELEFKAQATAYKGIEAFVIMDARITAKSSIQIEGLGGYEIVNQGEGSFGIKISSPPSADVKFTYSSKF
ncbi:MAG TPA: hypothetical protein VK174_10090, partial [Chitinophagales bacterium]|nr:hypothetical protein [Chitinophagales bacterium]